jgi:hypothetical protein
VPRMVYVVQKLDWQYNDVFFEIGSEIPVKAFARLRDATAYRQKLEVQAQRDWNEERARRGDTDRFYEVVPVEIDE